MRRPLLWLGMAEPLATQAELRGSDPIRAALVSVMTAWHETFGERATTVAAAVEGAAAPGIGGNRRLLEALSEVAGERGGGINNRRLGRWLVRHLRRIEGGRRFEDGGEDPGTCRRRFRVTSVSSVRPSRFVGNANDKTNGGSSANADNADNAENVCPRCQGEGCEWCGK